MTADEEHEQPEPKEWGSTGAMFRSAGTAAAARTNNVVVRVGAGRACPGSAALVGVAVTVGLAFETGVQAIAGIAGSISVRVFLGGILDLRAVVTCVADAIGVGVHLGVVGYHWTVVSSVHRAVPVIIGIVFLAASIGVGVETKAVPGDCVA